MGSCFFLLRSCWIADDGSQCWWQETAEPLTWYEDKHNHSKWTKWEMVEDGLDETPPRVVLRCVDCHSDEVTWAVRNRLLVEIDGHELGWKSDREDQQEWMGLVLDSGEEHGHWYPEEA